MVFPFQNVYDMPETLTATGELKLTGNNESDAAAMYGVQRKFGVKVTDEYTVNSGSIMLQSDYKIMAQHAERTKRWRFLWMANGCLL